MMGGKFIQNNLNLILLLRLGIVLMIFTLLRMLFYVFNYSYFSDLGLGELLKLLFYGIRFDLSAIFIVNLIYIFFQTLPFDFVYKKAYQSFTEIYFYITNSILIGLNCIDLVYYRFIFRRTTYDIFQAIFIGDDLKTLFWQYILDYWYVLICWIGLIVLMVFLYKRTKTLISVSYKTSLKKKILQFFLMIVWIGISVVLYRGGFQLRPITLVSAAEYADARSVPLLVNTPFSIISTYKKSGITEKNYFDATTLRSIFNPVKRPTKNNQPFKNYNIVIIIFESLSKEYVGALNEDTLKTDYESYTPFLDSLASKSMCFTNAYANGRRSIEGIPAILSGIPTLMNNSYLTSVFSSNKINSLPILLKEYGYSSSFFHGGKNGTMNFDAYSKIAGFDYYYGKNEYNNDEDYDGKWGIYDEEFLQFAAAKLNECRKPFVSAIFTLSSHHPYIIPKKYKNKFKKGSLEIHESIMYTDFSLKKFFQTCASMPWYENTIFIITADHSSITKNPIYQTDAGVYSIPIIIYKPDGSFLGKKSTICQQIDLMPTVLDILNYDKPFVSFGSSLFDTVSPHFSINFFNNTYQLINDSILLQFDGEQSLSAYDFKNDRLLTKNIVSEQKERIKDTENFIKAFIQQYNYRMIKNKLTEIDE